MQASPIQRAQRVRSAWTNKKTIRLGVSAEYAGYIALYFALSVRLPVVDIAASLSVVLIGQLLQLRQRWRAQDNEHIRDLFEQIQDVDIYESTIATRDRFFGLGVILVMAYTVVGVVAQDTVSSEVATVLFRQVVLGGVVEIGAYWVVYWLLVAWAFGPALLLVARDLTEAGQSAVEGVR